MPSDPAFQPLAAACIAGGFGPEIFVHEGASRTWRMIRIPNVGAERAADLEQLCRRDLPRAGFRVDYHAYDARYGTDNFKGAMIIGHIAN